MKEIKWTVEAAQAYKRIYDSNPSLRKLIDLRLKTLAEWPPVKWFDLREKDGIIRFQTDTDQFLILTGRLEEEDREIWIYRFELRTERRR